MTGVVPCAILVAGLFGAIRASAADGADHPYQKIIDRNVFRLKAAGGTNTAVAATPHKPLPRIKLTGLTTILGDKRAFFEVMIFEQFQVPREESCILTEGKGEGGIKLLAIDERARTATFNNHGVIQLVELGSAEATTGPRKVNALGMPLKF
jgi:hypothetical protein